MPRSKYHAPSEWPADDEAHILYPVVQRFTSNTKIPFKCEGWLPPTLIGSQVRFQRNRDPGLFVATLSLDERGGELVYVVKTSCGISLCAPLSDPDSAKECCRCIKDAERGTR